LAELSKSFHTPRTVDVVAQSDALGPRNKGISHASIACMRVILKNHVRRLKYRLRSSSHQQIFFTHPQFATSSLHRAHGGRRHRPYVFTEQGVAMLSSVLRSPAAIAVNIEIMRAFVRLRRATLVSQQLTALIADLSNRVDSHDAAIKGLIDTIRRLVEARADSRKRPIGFVPIE
jgi:hypothetical protein